MVLQQAADRADVVRPQLVLEVEVENGNRGAEAFPSPGVFGGLQQVLKSNDLVPQIAVAFHALPLLVSQPPTSLPISSMALAAKP